ncbi:unnamed protein product [Dicrocoelium dendriticum]|nr:unnamed protein product [Dicrocoelium dendriticum]
MAGRRSSQRMRHTPLDIEDVASAEWHPANWRKHLQNICEMRSSRDAPVDTMGCECLANKLDDPKNFRFQILLSLMLSSQTRDQTTAAAMQRLQTYGCSLERIMSMDRGELEKLIYPVSFYRHKAKHILSTCEVLKNSYNGDIPHSVQDLCQLPGVGPKMAHLAMLCAWNEVTGVGVDTHVHRIANRLGWTKRPTKTPEETRKALEAWLPRDKWNDITLLLVGFGQQQCLPVSPRCHSCLNRMICPTGRKYKLAKK